MSVRLRMSVWVYVYDEYEYVFTYKLFQKLAGYVTSNWTRELMKHQVCVINVCYFD